MDTCTQRCVEEMPCCLSGPSLPTPTPSVPPRLENRLTADVGSILQLLQRQAVLVPPTYSALSSPQPPPNAEPPLGEHPLPLPPILAQALCARTQVSVPS